MPVGEVTVMLPLGLEQLVLSTTVAFGTAGLDCTLTVVVALFVQPLPVAVTL